MNYSAEQHFHVTLADANPLRVTYDKLKTFRRLLIYGVKTAPVNDATTDNDNVLYIGRFGDGRKVFPSQVAANPGGRAESAPYEYLVPPGMPEMRVYDIWILGTAGDGALVTYITENINPELK